MYEYYYSKVDPVTSDVDLAGKLQTSTLLFTNSITETAVSLDSNDYALVTIYKVIQN